MMQRLQKRWKVQNVKWASQHAHRVYKSLNLSWKHQERAPRNEAANDESEECDSDIGLE